MEGVGQQTPSNQRLWRSPMTQEHPTNFSRVLTGCHGQGHHETDAVITTSAGGGAHSPDSDIDLLVDDTGTHGHFPLLRLCAALRELLGFNIDGRPCRHAPPRDPGVSSP